MRTDELIRWWNAKKGTKHTIRMNGHETQLTIALNKMMAKDGEDTVTAWVVGKAKDASVTNMMRIVDFDAQDEYRRFADGRKKPAVGETAQKMADSQVMQVLSQSIVTLLGKELSENITKVAIDKISEYVADKTLVKSYKRPDGTIKPLKGIVHKEFETVLQFVEADEPVFMTGPAGSGKNVIAKQVADALGLDFYFSNAVTQEYKITGFVDAMGNYQKTQFYDAFTKGGLFFLDEMDASVPEVLVVLNAAIANRYFDFPKMGRVEANPNFRVIGAGNTYGTGASMEYTGRYQLDGATLDRFAVVEIDYDPRVEEAVALGNKDCLEFCRAFRKACQSNGVKVITSYREIGRCAKMVAGGMEISKVLKTCLVKGLEKDTIRQVGMSIPATTPWKSQYMGLAN